MWTESITFQNDTLNAESRDAFAEAYGWQGAADPRGATKAQFRTWCLRNHVKEVVKSARVKADAAAQPTRVTDPDIS